jgi:nitrosocyanin
MLIKRGKMEPNLGKKKFTRRGFLKAVGVSGAALTGALAGGHVYAQELKEFNVTLRRYVITPNTFTVQKGDRVRFNIQSLDVEHGFYIDGYDLVTEISPLEQKTVEFTADKAGAFQIRCSITCGYDHPIMRAKLTVEPNLRFWASIGLAISVPIVTLIYLATKGDQDE